MRIGEPGREEKPELRVVRNDVLPDLDAPLAAMLEQRSQEDRVQACLQFQTDVLY